MDGELSETETQLIEGRQCMTEGQSDHCMKCAQAGQRQRQKSRQRQRQRQIQRQGMPRGDLTTL